MSNTATTHKLKVGISIGDINGIGLEVVLKALDDKRILHLCTPVIYGAAKVISYHKNIAKIGQISFNNVDSVDQCKDNTINVVNCWTENVKINLGECNADGGKYAHISLQKATDDLKLGLVDALVTAPINKEAMQLAGFGFPGHTEFLADALEGDSLMLMVHEKLRVGLVTNHLPLKEVAEQITEKLILQKIELMHHSLCRDFGINRPTIAVLGLNPHAGDGGFLGKEENDIIIPAIKAAKAKGILAIGPYAADGLFGSSNLYNFDGVLAMYHDQGLVPFKAMAFGGGVNFTAGLSAVRTSPDHGTGFDIVGKGLANEGSFRQALYLALDAAKQRVLFDERTSNPLQQNHADLRDEHPKRRNNRSKPSRNTNKEEQPKKAHPRKKEERTNEKSTVPAPEKHKKTVVKKEVEQKEDKKSIDKIAVSKSPVANEKATPPKKLSIEERLALAEERRKQKAVKAEKKESVTTKVEENKNNPSNEEE